MIIVIIRSKAKYSDPSGTSEFTSFFFGFVLLDLFLLKLIKVSLFIEGNMIKPETAGL
jgi:hypothetical protein